ncbi:MAG: arylesterase [Vicinamibacterales bacterium]
MAAPKSAVASAERAAKALRPTVVVLGDSLAAGYGLNEGESFPARLQERLNAGGYALDVANISVSGDTSAGGLRRLDWALEGDVRVLIIELGGNDGLRGLPVEDLRANLAAIIERGKAKGTTVVLTGMEAPPNFGPAYTAAFRQVYQDLAARYRIALVPFLLEGVAGIPDLNIADGIHPNLQGARLVEGNVWRVLQPLLKRPA